MRHGGNLLSAKARYGGETDDWLDLSTGINPHPWSNGHCSKFLVENDWTRLPDTSSGEALIGAAQTAYRAPVTLTIAATPGTQAALCWLARLAPAGPAAILAPTYTGHREAWLAAGRPLREASTLEDAATADTVILVNPNNPDGRIVPPETLLALARDLAARGGLLIVDEAFADVTPQASVLPHIGDEPVAVLRSFGKFFGLAGLRLGFLAAQPELAGTLSASLGPWAISGPALTIGRAALLDLAWRDAMRTRLSEETAALDETLAASGLNVLGGTSLFRLVAHERAHALHEALARRHIWTRRFDEQPGWLRLGLPESDAALDRLAAALGDAMTETGA